MTGLSTMRRVFDVELLINIAARSAAGILSATVFSLVVWWGTRIFLRLNPADLGLGMYFLTQATIIGGAATVVVVVSGQLCSARGYSTRFEELRRTTLCQEVC